MMERAVAIDRYSKFREGEAGVAVRCRSSDKSAVTGATGDRMTAKTDDYIKRRGLIETSDPEIDNPIFRLEGHEGTPALGDMDNRIGEALRVARERQGLTRPDLSPLLGLTTQVYGRYERGEAKLHVTRLVHLCEILGFSPLELIFAAAPHLWGDAQEEAETRYRLMRHIEQLPLEKTKLLLGVVESFLATEKSSPAST
jgi:transcriptional regulator with XRE-family HTH domain